MKISANYTEKVKEAVYGFGATLVGVANTTALRGLPLNPPDLLESFVSAISIAVKLPKAVFEGITDRPTPFYRIAYDSANRLLDEIAFRTANLLEDDGFPSLPVPASQTIDRENHVGAISHKAVARMAGLGWQGKSLNLVTPEYGPRVRLVTVLTKASLVPGKPTENRCGDCMKCRDACPAGAIKGMSTKTHYASRDEALYFSRCLTKLNEFANIPGVMSDICGVCIKVCPYANLKER